MADNYRSRMFRDVARYATQQPDGRILYFESDGVQSSEGELPPGSDAKELEAQGFVLLDTDAYERTRQSLDPIARAENAEADELAIAFDASMGPKPGGDDMYNENEDTLNNLLTMRAGAAPWGSQMNGQGGGMNGMDPEMMAVLEQYMNEGRLEDLFTPFQQQQQLIAQAQQAPRPASPTGAVLGGLSRAIGTGGQAALNKKMQGDASGRLQALMEMRQKQMGINPETGLMATAVDDATLASLFGG
jgi:hypothetical protein